MKCLCFRWSLWLEPPSATEHAQFKRRYTRRAETGSGTKRESPIVTAEIDTRYSGRERLPMHTGTSTQRPSHTQEYICSDLACATEILLVLLIMFTLPSRDTVQNKKMWHSLRLLLSFSPLSWSVKWVAGHVSPCLSIQVGGQLWDSTFESVFM